MTIIVTLRNFHCTQIDMFAQQMVCVYTYVLSTVFYTSLKINMLDDIDLVILLLWYEIFSFNCLWVGVYTLC